LELLNAVKCEADRDMRAVDSIWRIANHHAATVQTLQTRS
jgi:hypothetical protein